MGGTCGAGADAIQARILRAYFEHKTCTGKYCPAAQRVFEKITTTPSQLSEYRKLALIIQACYDEVERGADCVGILNLALRYEQLGDACFGAAPVDERRPARLPDDQVRLPDGQVRVSG